MSDDEAPFKSSNIAAEASAWIAQLETRDLTAEDLRAFREWIQRTPRHAAEVRRLARLSEELNVLTEMAGPLEAAATQLNPLSAGRRKRRWPIRALVFSCAAVFLVGAAFFALRWRAAVHEDSPQLIATGIGDYRDVVLPDGTTLELNSNSQVKVDYSKAERRVRLLRGEAFFDVAEDSSRPFVVSVREQYVWAVGTAFGVRLYEDDFEVTVGQGRVALGDSPFNDVIGQDGGTTTDLSVEGRDNALGSSDRPLILRAGQTALLSSLSEPPAIVDITERELMRKMSWRDNLLEFYETSLADVVAEVSRHTTMRIEIADRDLEKLTFGGIFRTGDTDALLDALEASYGIDVEYVGENRVRLTARADG